MSAYLTLDQVADRLHVPFETARFWVKVGKLPAFKPGRHVLVREADLHAFVEGAALGKVRADRVKRARSVRKGRAA